LGFVFDTANLENVLSIKRNGTAVGGWGDKGRNLCAFIGFWVKDFTRAGDIVIDIRKSADHINKAIGITD
jgi:hypothetical protein